MRITWWLYPGLHETPGMRPKHSAHNYAEPDGHQVRPQPLPRARVISPEQLESVVTPQLLEASSLRV